MPLLYLLYYNIFRDIVNLFVVYMLGGFDEMIMIIKRKWARTGSVIKWYIQIFIVILVTILLLSYHSWRRKRDLAFQQKTNATEFPGWLNTILKNQAMNYPFTNFSILIDQEKQVSKPPPETKVKSLIDILKPSPLDFKSNIGINVPTSHDFFITQEPIQDIIRKALGFSESGKKLAKKKLPNEITNVLLLSSGRSGGGFLGQLLNNIFPDTFYALDPLFLAVYYQVSQDTLIDWVEDFREICISFILCIPVFIVINKKG